MATGQISILTRLPKEKQNQITLIPFHASMAAYSVLPTKHATVSYRRSRTASDRD
jgi:hypothetical protein